MKKQAKKPVVKVKGTEGLSYEKDPRFIAFIKHRMKLAEDPKNRIDGYKAMDEINKKYGLGKYRYGL